MGTMESAVGQLVTERVVDAPPSLTLRQAAQRLDDEAVGALLVHDPRGVIGIVTERDLVRALADGADPDEDRISDQLTDDLLLVDHGTTVLEALQLMCDNTIRHLVVRRSDGDGVAGVVSMRAVVDTVMADVLDRPAATMATT